MGVDQHFSCGSCLFGGGGGARSCLGSPENDGLYSWWQASLRLALSGDKGRYYMRLGSSYTFVNKQILVGVALLSILVRVACWSRSCVKDAKLPWPVLLYGGKSKLPTTWRGIL
jgi:hypothetical protein